MADPAAPRTPRRPLTADDPPPVFSAAFFERVNDGDLEAAYERRQADPRTWNPIPWGWLVVGILIGVVFAYVNAYAALAVGFIVGGSWYLSYFVGLLARLRPGAINYVAGASTGASQVVVGLAFVLPALFLLSDRAGGAALYTFDELPSPFALAGFFLVGGLYGVLFFQFYRRLWVVERPLQYPGGFESSMELLALADVDRAGQREEARRTVFVVAVAALLSGFFVILRDLRAFGSAPGREPFLDRLFAGRNYLSGNVPDTWQYRPFYNGFLYLDPFLLAVGWFVRARVALILLLGALVTYLLPFADSGTSDAFSLFVSWVGSARTLAAGAILGAGVLALVRLRHVVATGLRTILDGIGGRTEDGGPRRGFVLLAFLVGGWAVASVLLVAGGAPIGASILVAPIGILLIGLLGLVAVKVTGETSVQAVSPLTVLALLALIGVLQLAGYSGPVLLIMSLGTAAFFATGLVMSTDIFLDSKVALYVGNPPHRQALAQILGLIPGVLVGTALVWFLTIQVIDGALPGVNAPFGRVFAGLAEAFSGGDVDWALFGIAVLLGAAVELATGLGTAFGIGMALQAFVPVTLFLGALAREAYERLAARRGADAAERSGTLVRVAAPTGVFVGASLAVILVFVLHQWVL